MNINIVGEKKKVDALSHPTIVGDYFHPFLAPTVENLVEKFVC